MYRGAIIGTLLLFTPALAAADTCPSLSLGSSGTSVTAVQKILYAAYANFPSPTGKFDATTQAAIKQWQKEHGISQTGTVGPITAAAMKLCVATQATVKSAPPATTIKTSGATTRTLARGMSGTDVVALQQFLISQNLLTAGNASGFFGALTEAAVQSFQRAKGIASSGTPATTGYGAVGPKTRVALSSQSAVPSTPGTPITPPLILTIPTPTPTPVPPPVGTSTPAKPGTPVPPPQVEPVKPAPGLPPTCAISASPSSVSAGATTTLSWSSSGATSASLNGGIGAVSTQGSRVIQPSTFTYVLTLVGSSTVTCQAPVVVHATPPPVIAPVVSLTADGKESMMMQDGAVYTIAYNTSNVSSCTMSYAQSNGAQASGSYPVPPNSSGSGQSGLIGSYTLTCTGTNGQAVSKKVTVSEDPASLKPSCTLAASPASITAGQSTTLSWTLKNSTSFSIPGVANTGSSAAASIQVSPTQTTTYIGTVTGVQGNATCQTAVQVTPVQVSLSGTKLFSSPASISVPGTTYTDTIPDTLDLATRAQMYIRGTMSSHVDTANPWGLPTIVWAPASPGIFRSADPGFENSAAKCAPFGGPPCLSNKDGIPNWGKVGLALMQAREMSGYDLNDGLDSVRSLSAMVDVAAVQWFAARGGGPAPMTNVMQALIFRYREDPGNSNIKNAVDELVRMHAEILLSTVRDGKTYYYFYNDTDQGDSLAGYYGFESSALQQGKVGQAMGEWCFLTGSASACDIMGKMNDYARGFPDLWRIPSGHNPGIPQGSAGQFAGHIHSWLQLSLSMVEEARARLVSNPSDTIAKQDLRLSRDMLEFVIKVTEGGSVGNFGEIGSTGDMVRIAVALNQMKDYFPELSIGHYNDQIERWTRNELAEKQIDDKMASYISDSSIANRVKGIFISDATHVFSVPFKIFRYSADEQANPLRGMYAAWDYAVEVKQSVAKVNLLLNRSHAVLDVKSDLPYRGRVEVITKNALGSVRDLSVHIPGWTDSSKVVITRIQAGKTDTLAQGTHWRWEGGGYIYIPNISASTQYIVTFPMKVVRMPVVELRDQGQWWYEGSYPSSCCSGDQRRTEHNGVFLGYDLVSASEKPYDGVKRYQRSALLALIQGSTVTEIAPPQRTAEVFAFRGSVWTPLKAHVPQEVIWPTAPGILSVDGEMAPFISAAGSGAAAWLEGDKLGNYLYGSQAQLILHEQHVAATGDTTGRIEVPCSSVASLQNVLVLLVAGQSNAANSAQADANGQFFTSNGPIYNLNIGDGKCYAAKNPLLGADATLQSFAYPLASLFVDAGLAKGVLIVPVAVSGTLIEQWVPAPWRTPGAQHFKRIETAIQKLQAIGLKPTFILWHQGEGNAGGFINKNTPDGTPIAITKDIEYAGTLSWMRNFFRMIAGIRGMGLTDVRIFVAQATSCGPTATSEVVRRAQRSVVDPVWNIYAGPDTDALPFSLRRADDGCHFTHQGNITHAQKWFDILKNYVTAPPDPSPSTPTVTLTVDGKDSIVYSGANYSLVYGSSNATSCTMSYAGQSSGSFPVNPNTSASGPSGLIGTYTFTCSNSSGNASKTVTISPPLGSATVSVTVNGAQAVTLPLNGNFTLAYASSNANSCTISYSIAGGVAQSSALTPNTSGTSPGAAPQGGVVYTFVCIGANGQQVSSTASVTTTVPAPTCAISVSPSTIPPGGSATLSWTWQNASSITIAGVGTSGAQGSTAVSPSVTSTYNATVFGPGGEGICSTLLTVSS